MASNTRSRRSTTTQQTQEALKRDKERTVDPASLSIIENLILAQAVYEFGANNWSAVAKLLSKHPLLSRPKWFFTAQSCYQIYIHLMNEAQIEITEENNKEHADGNVQLARRHYDRRFAEIHELISIQETEFKKILGEIEAIRAGEWDEKIKARVSGARSPSPEPQEQESSPVDVAIPPPPTAQDIIDSELRALDTSSPPPEGDQDGPIPNGGEPDEQEHKDTVVGDGIDKAEVVDTDIVPEPSPEAAVPTNGTSTESPQQKDDLMDGPEIATRPIASQESVEMLEPAQPVVEDVEESPQKPQEEPTPMDVVDEAQVGTIRPDNEEILPKEPELETPKDTEAVHTPATAQDSPLSKADKSTEVENKLEGETAAEGKATAEKPDSPTASPSPAPTRRRQIGKRKASDLGIAASESTRDKKRVRDESEPFDDADTGPGGAARRKKFISVMSLLHTQISTHRAGNLFHIPVRPADAPGYDEIVRRPIDLRTIKQRLKDGVISNSREYQRDIYLMFANAMMYNKPGSSTYEMAEEMMLASDGYIQQYLATEGFTPRNT